MLLFWTIIFITSLIILVKGADWLLDSAEKIGISIGLSPFVVGVVIVGLGTSAPELVSSFAAVIAGVTEIVPANAVGSNIANILLVVGISAVVAGRLTVTKNLIDLELPLLALSTVLFLGVAWDKVITLGESLLLIAAFVVYLLYTLLNDDGGDSKAMTKKRDRPKEKLATRDILWLIVGIAGLVVGSKYLIDSVIKLSEILQIGAGVIAISAVALGTSLPELLVSVKAALQKKSELALGNIFGSNAFNLLIVVGLPGLLGTLLLDDKTFSLGLPVLAAVTFLFIVSGISKRIHVWEGAMYLVVYLFFIGKLFAFF